MSSKLKPGARARRLVCTLLLAGLASASSIAGAASERIVISTGLEGGSYFHIGARLKTELVLRNETQPAVIPSPGSLDNLARLDDPDGLVNVVLTQADALRTYLASHPDFREEFFVLGDVGKECALLITSKQGGLADAAQLKTPGGGALAVHSGGSGAAVTWAAMQSLEPAYGATETATVPIMEALLQIKDGGEFSNIKSTLIVQRPSRLSPAVRTVIETPEAYRFVAIRPDDLPNATLPDGTAIYTFEKVAIGPASSQPPVEVETLCTRGLMLGSRVKLDTRMRERLATIMLEAGDTIAGKR